MNLRRKNGWRIAATLAALSITLSVNKAAAFQPGPPSAEEGVEVLTRGPVHEAFAETVTFDPEPGLLAPKSPPADIEEVPPETRPEGAHVAWIPGYWAWDDERTDFLWISGIWRALPPGRQWVPGYWGKSGSGSQWTAGYWADATLTDVEYLPEPPATVEAGPNVAAASVDQTWLPGSWVWRENRYAWRPGYWTTGHSDWNWIPDHYVWSPRGYVFVDGYYDYSVSRRGVLFAPVYFNSAVYARRGYTYSPSFAISPAVFTNHLFVRPGYGHYFYGDYYAANYTTVGFTPWFSFSSSRYGYDPIYAQQRWIHRQDRDWEHKVQANYRDLRENENSRPPRTWADQRTRTAKATTADSQSFVVAASLDDLAKNKDHALRFQAVDKAERQQYVEREQAARQFRGDRQKLEGGAADPATVKTAPATEPKAFKGKLPQSPFFAPAGDRLGKEFTPPKTIEQPQLDAKIEPKPRKGRGNVEAPRPERKENIREPKADGPKTELKQPPQGETKKPPSGRANDKPQDAPSKKPDGPAKGPPNRANDDKPPPAPEGKSGSDSNEKSKK